MSAGEAEETNINASCEDNNVRAHKINRMWSPWFALTYCGWKTCWLLGPTWTSIVRGELLVASPPGNARTSASATKKVRESMLKCDGQANEILHDYIRWHGPDCLCKHRCRNNRALSPCHVTYWCIAILVPRRLQRLICLGCTIDIRLRNTAFMTLYATVPTRLN